MKTLAALLAMTFVFSFSVESEARRKSSKNLINAALIDSIKENKQFNKRNKRKRRASDVLVRRTRKKEVVKVDAGTDYKTLSQREDSEVLKWNDKQREKIEDIPMFISEE